MTTTSPTLPENSLTTEEIIRAARHLSIARGYLLDTVYGLSASQWNFRPDNDSWSIADNVEHLVLIEGRVHAIIGNMINAAEAEPGHKESVMDDFIISEAKTLLQSKSFFNFGLPGQPLDRSSGARIVYRRPRTDHAIAGGAAASRTSDAASVVWPMGWLSMAAGGRIPQHPAHQPDPRSESSRGFSASVNTRPRCATSC
jgi:hypothetical protein